MSTLYYRILEALLQRNVALRTWVPITLRYKCATLQCKIMLVERTRLVICIHSQKEYIFHINKAGNVFKDFYTPLSGFKFREQLDIPYLEIVCIAYPFQKAYTFLPKYQEQE